MEEQLDTRRGLWRLTHDRGTIAHGPRHREVVTNSPLRDRILATADILGNASGMYDPILFGLKQDEFPLAQEGLAFSLSSLIPQHISIKGEHQGELGKLFPIDDNPLLRGTLSLPELDLRRDIIRIATYVQREINDQAIRKGRQQQFFDALKQSVSDPKLTDKLREGTIDIGFALQRLRPNVTTIAIRKDLERTTGAYYQWQMEQDLNRHTKGTGDTENTAPHT